MKTLLLSLLLACTYGLQAQNTPNGKQTEKLDMRSYKKGRYYIHAISGNSRIVEQLIKE